VKFSKIDKVRYTKGGKVKKVIIID
jgi:hypothetical protein